jgi:hypothetical protein
MFRNKWIDPDTFPCYLEPEDAVQSHKIDEFFKPVSVHKAIHTGMFVIEPKPREEKLYGTVVICKRLTNILDEDEMDALIDLYKYLHEDNDRLALKTIHSGWRPTAHVSDLHALTCYELCIREVELKEEKKTHRVRPKHS